MKVIHNKLLRFFHKGKFNKIKVNSVRDDIRLKQSKQYRIIYVGSKKTIPNVKVQNNKLTVQDKSNNEHTLTIEYPAAELKELKINANNGVESSRINVLNGSIISKNVGISINTLNIKQKFNMETKFGNIKIRHSNAKGYHLSSKNGEVEFKGRKVTSIFNKNKSSAPLLSASSIDGNVEIN